MREMKSLIVSLLFLANNISAIQVYESCEELKYNTPTELVDSLVDGFQFIKLRNGIGIQVYCKNMAPQSSGSPTQYIHLQSGRSANYAEKYRYVGSDKACTLEEAPEEDYEGYGKTEFEKVKFDPTTRTITTDDFTFATTVYGQPVNFAHAGDKHSFSPDCTPMGKFAIDLEGTPWRINKDMVWNWQGSFANGDNTQGQARVNSNNYLGCYIDQGERDLAEMVISSSSMTGDVCIKHCYENGFEYAGTQYAQECFCGHKYGSFGKTDESDCNMACTGNSQEMCGGVWRNSVYSTAPSQGLVGYCGGYPGSCYPSANTQTVVQLKLDMESTHPCLIQNPCYNSGVCVATNVNSFLCLCHTGYVGAYCEVVEEPQMYDSAETSTADDATAFIACPAGSMAVTCECVGKYCDGAWFVGDECRVTHSGKSGTSKARVTCWQYDPTYLYLINVESTDMHNPTAQCPQDSIMTGCASLDFWYQQVTYGHGTVDNSTTPETCRQDYCKTTPNGCKVQARCLIADCGCKNGGVCVHISGQCDCQDGYYGSKCENFDYCAFYEDTNNEAACLNDGQCSGVPSHVVATVGGSGNNENCQFPYTYQDMTYSQCVATNEVGPPFACGAVLDGQDSYIDLGKWNPGPVYSMEVWARATAIPDGRHAVAGGFDTCRDWGIGMEGGHFKAFYNPPDSCTSSIRHSEPVQTNKWYYLAKTCDGQTSKFYINGKLIGSATVKKMMPGTANGFYVGGEACCGNYFPGEVKSLRVWKRPLTETEVKDGYENEHLAHIQSTENALNKGLVGYWDFGESKHPPCTGNDHMGADWFLNDGSVISGVHCNISHLVIPDYSTVRVQAWDGSENSGKIEIYAKNIDIYGTLTATGKGFRGGESPTATHSTGMQGETFSGNYPTSNTITHNIGGGGGGGGETDGSVGYGKPGGGGGYGTSGGTCKLRPGKDVTHCGEGGQSYGDDKLSTLHLGSGGGSGGNDNVLNDNPVGGRGGNGGGAIRLDALEHIEIVGYVEVNGEIGQGDASTSCDACPSACQDQNTCTGGGTTTCYDFSGAGGGGSGGSLYLRGQVVNVGLNHISVEGGRGGHGANVACGGDGGKGRIRIDYVELLGQWPSYAVTNPYDKTYTDKSYIGQQQIDISNTNYGNEVFLGCFEDKDDRHMKFQVPLSDDDKAKLTPEYCILKCRENGYRYSGTEYSNECFCDDQIGKHVLKPEEDCGMACSGDADQICGGSLRLTIYGPPPLAGAATEHNGVVQECKPWCVNSNADDPMTWGECTNDGYIEEYSATCDCAIGYTGDNCGQPCPHNTWGKDCASTCSCIAVNTDLCDPQTGSCVCSSGFYGDRCQYECADGTWGQDCTQTCSCGSHGSTDPNQPTCDGSTGACYCQTGYTGYSCDQSCAAGNWGPNCATACNCQHGACDPTNGVCTCYSGYTGTTCDQSCPDYAWGSYCTLTCDCNGHLCQAETGECICPPTATGSRCENGCPPNMWGNECTNQCNCGIHSLGCVQSSGTCHCDVGYTGTLCDLGCPVGTFGSDCAYTCQCSVENIEKCEPSTGACICKPGYQGVQCHTTCSPGTYGSQCASICSCQGGTPCDPITGSCDQCPSGFVGQSCENTCPQGYYGDRCQSLCNCASASITSCDGVTGYCYCKPGYTGDQCQSVCDNLHWGQDCAFTCQCVQANTQSCDPTTGTCTCEDGYDGQTCDAVCSGNQCLGVGCNCQNNGLCLSDGSCDCLEGYQGTKCETQCPQGKYGKNCAYNCFCMNGATCSVTDGTCTCAAGYQGSDCSVTCSSGFFGQNCAYLCQCLEGSCNAVDGSCNCNPGYTGPTCSTKCPPGMYGAGCLYTCPCDITKGTCDHVTGVCECNAGYTGTQCTSQCLVGKFGANCAYPCPNCGTNAASGCDPVNGDCICNPGYQSTYCDQRCAPGYYGQNCASRCTYDCKNSGLCDSETGVCHCAAGFTGNDCSNTCLEGYYGPNCAGTCQCISEQSDHCDKSSGECHCMPGYIGDICETTCPAGYYGSDCRSSCLCDMTSSTCNPINGLCSCMPGYYGSDCSSFCPEGTWGADCSSTCYCSEFTSSCDPSTGKCNCLPGYTGNLCDTECENSWGQDCAYQCSCQNEGQCDHRNGVCQCSPGYTGHSCESVCDSKHFGYNCAQLCSCPDTCDPVLGACMCSPGYTGSNCETACGSGFWGAGCINQCSEFCPIASQCDIVTGVCLCPIGFGGQYCNKTCGAGRWGPDCIEYCPSTCSSACDTQDGNCYCGSMSASCKNGGECKGGKCHCRDGYGGDDCTGPQTSSTGNNGGVIAAAVICSLLVVVIIVLAVYLIYYKRKFDVSQMTLKSFDPRKLFTNDIDAKTFYDKEEGVSVENPNYGFDTEA